MSYVLSEKDFRTYSQDFAPVGSVNRTLGANIGAVWRELLSLGDDTVHRVSGFVSRGSNVYALVSDTYKDTFNLISWIGKHIDFKSKVTINPFNYSLVFGEGSLPRDIEEILEELNSVRSLSANSSPYSAVAPIIDVAQEASYDDGATSFIAEDHYVISGSGFQFSVFDEGSEYIMGRGSGSTFVVSGVGVSRNHLKFKYEDGDLQIFDLGSTNGTRLNGGRIRRGEWVKVPNGSTIKIGRITMTVGLVEE